MSNPNAREPLPMSDGRRQATRLTPELLMQIVGALKLCGSIKTASLSCGVPWSTAKDWLRKGKQGIEPYDGFVAAMERTKAERCVVLDSYILKAAQRGEWRAAAALRDRRSAAQKARDSLALPPDGDEERVVFMYPVPMPEGADPAQMPMIAGHALDTTGEETSRTTTEDDDDADD